MTDINTILNKRSELKDEAIKIIDSCKTEIRGMTDEELNRINEIKEELMKLEDEVCSVQDQEDKEVKNIDKTTEQDDEKEENPSDDSVNDSDDESEDKDNTETKDNSDKDKEDEEEQRNTHLNNTEKNNITNKMEKRFSILTAIRNISNGQTQDNVTAAVLAQGNSEMRKAGLNFVGQIQLPVETRSLTVADEGEDVVATDFLDVVKPLQAMNVMIKAGAKYVTGLVGDIQYPVMSNGSCTWEGETASAKDGSPAFTNVKLSPKRLTAIVPISKQFLIQDSIGAENAIREEIINAINAKLEATILGDGAGSATEPAGLLANVTNSVTNFNGLCDLEAELEVANVYGDLKYIVAPKAKSALRNMAKSSKSTQLVFENGEIDGTPALCTSHVKETNFVYGDFSQFIIAQWGNLDITVDNVTLADKGQVRLVVNAYFDAKPLRDAAFVTGKIGA